jgi:hypothetical protein
MKNFIRLFIGWVWLFSAIPIMAQKEMSTTQKDGLQIVKIKTIEGTVTVNLPSDIYSGDVISGTVIAEPKKTNKKNKSKKELKKEEENKTNLLAHVITLFGTNVLVSQDRFSIDVPQNGRIPSPTIELKNVADELVESTTLSVNHILREPLQGNYLQLPAFMRSGYYQEIKGNFDGNFGNTLVSLDGSPINIMAESPDRIVITTPENLHGVKQLSIKENENEYLADIAIVNLDLTADKIDLLKGESTNINLIIEGLGTVDAPVEIHVDNLSPANISLSGGNHQEIVIEPETVPETGIYSNAFAITAKLSGGYSVSAQLIVPELEPVPIDEVEKPKDPVEKCGFAWYGKWKKIKTITKADESQKQVVKSTHRKCTVCQKSSVWTYYKIPMFRYNVEERDKFTCTMIKGHAGSHHGTSKKEQREVAVGTAFRYKIVRTGDCGHTVFVKWKKK